MKRFLVVIGLILGALFLNSCATDGITTNVQSGNQNVNEIASYNGPKARIAVAHFRCKAAKCSSGIGSGIKDMLVDSLFRSNRFIVLERDETFKDVQKELAMENGKYFNKKQGPKGGHLERADILVTGAIVAFEPNESGTSGGIGSVIGGILGGIGAKSKNAYIAADIRLVDVATGRIINSTRVEGKASSFSVGGLGGGLIGHVPLGGAFRVYKNTPMEKAVMVMLDNAVKSISRLIPERYYRYK
jgi:curli biogenesis system outer membrane secretion channel CsgG